MKPIISVTIMFFVLWRRRREKNIMLMDVFKLIRVEHWVKNLLIFMPPFFLGNLLDKENVLRALPAFFAFSLVASAIYVFNDIKDVEKDRLHPKKCNRPIASGKISIGVGYGFAFFLFLSGFALAIWASSIVLAIFAMLIYVISNVAYSARFKNTPIVDIFILAFGFVIRVFYGGFYFGVPISSWMFLSVFSGALYFACGKRMNELRQIGFEGETRSVLRSYSQRFLDAHYYMFCGLTILFYSLWTITRSNQYSVSKLALTIPILIGILARYNLLIESDKCDGDPVPVLLHDRLLICAVALFGLVNAVILYWGDYLPKVTY